MTAVLVAVAFVIAVAVYFVFRRTPNQFPIDIGNMTPRERADVLLHATIWRLRWETDNPHAPDIFLDPASCPPEAGKVLFRQLFDMWVQLRQNHDTLTRRLRALGSTEKLPDADVNGCLVWLVTIGARSGKQKREDMLQVWTHLQEAIPFVDQSMAALMERQEISRKLGKTSDRLLGLDAGQVVREARRIPAL
jgi:hypothetical protein